jgi:sigma-54 dependent transcriptional regulator, gfr operon transcriptional activator
MNTKKVEEYLNHTTSISKLMNEEDELHFFSSTYIGNILGLTRNAVSQIMNKLLRVRKVIKINTRPVYFFSKEVLEKEFETPIEETIFSSIEELLHYVEKKEHFIIDPFSKFIGHSTAVQEEVEQCKVAVNYPPSGLPILISGPTGVGKSFLARLMFEYAVDRGIIEGKAPFILINCAEFANNPELLTANLFGSVKGSYTGADKDKAGFIEEANGGFLFLDEVHRLSPEGQEKLFLFLDQGKYRRLGETKDWRQSEVRFIFATTEKPDAVFLKTFLRRIPIKIQLRSLMERTFNDKFSIIYHFIQQESKRLQRVIKVSKQVMYTLIHSEFQGNIGELRNVIKHSCANAFFKDIHLKKSTADPLDVNVSHLPNDFIKSESILDYRITKDFPLSDILVSEENSNPIQESNWLKDTILESHLVDITRVYENYQKDILSLDEFILDITKLNDQYLSSVIYQIKDELTFNIHRFNYIKNSIENILMHMTPYVFPNAATFLTYIITYRSKFLYKSTDTHRKVHEVFSIVGKKNFREEYELTVNLVELVNMNLGLDLTKEDLLVVFLYLKKLYKKEEKSIAKAIIITHGNSTSSSIADLANKLLGHFVFEAIDMPFETDIYQTISHLKKYMKSINTEHGVLVLVDMGSLEDIHHNLIGLVKGTIGIMNNITTYLALNVGEKIINGKSVEEILELVSKDSQPKYKIIKGEFSKKNAIITTCVTGVGTAEKIKELLIKSIQDFVTDIEFLPLEYSRLKQNQREDPIFNLYNVIAIIGTSNSVIDNVPFISLEDLIQEKGYERFYSILKEVLDEKETIQKINNRIVKLFSLESVFDHLTILNPEKLINHLEMFIESMQMELQIDFSNSLKIGLFVHIGCLVERLVKSQPIEHHDQLEYLEQCHQNFIIGTKKSFSVIERIYNVTIPSSEIAYIYDLVGENALNKA